jgi:hypothetical protein
LFFFFGFIKCNAIEKPQVIKKLDSGNGCKNIENDFPPVSYWHSGEGKKESVVLKLVNCLLF